MEKILITKEGKKFFYRGEDVHTKFGFVKKDDIEKAKPGSIVKTHIGKEFTIIPVSFIDKLSKIKRAPQIIPLKDVGMIVAETGLEPNWKIVDAGAGSGALCCHLANLVPKGKVYAYEIRDDHLNVVQENIKFFGFKNITAKKLSVYDKIPHKNIDLITLDLPEPWLALENAVKALRPGGFLVSYSPCIPQVSDFVEKVKVVKNEDGSGALTYINTVELIYREWEMIGRKQRPKTQQLGHSGFISFVRKI
ncbi:MAG: methyltransferase domain-containing protein [Candidatus Woesearchaeota archaeon]